jgi:ribonuclease P protein component
MADPTLPETGPAAGFVRLRRLKARTEFTTAAARGSRAHRPTLSLQRHERADGDTTTGVGFTVTKKEGNSVERNRIRRRLREAARMVMPAHADAGADYVVIGRRTLLDSPFPSLMNDLKEALAEASRRRARGAKTALRMSKPAAPPLEADENGTSDA